MTVGTERLAIDPCLRNSVNGLGFAQAAAVAFVSTVVSSQMTLFYVQHFADNSGACNLDENDVVETNAVEGVEERDRALDLVRLDHGFEDVVHGEFLALAREVVSDGQDGAKIVGGMAPCSSGGFRAMLGLWYYWTYILQLRSSR